MRFTLVSAMFLSVLLAAATGCSATSSQAAKTPASADLAEDPSFTPPDQFKMAISEGKPSQAKSEVVSTLPSPNKREIRAGQLKAGY